VIYRSFAFGKLMELVMTDERLYRDGPPDGNETTDRYVTPGSGKEEAPGRTMLGDGTPGVDGLRRPQQVGYFLQKVTRSTRKWKVWGNEVTFMQMKLANTSVESETSNIASLDELFPGIENYPAAQAVGAPEGVYVTLDQWDGYQAERRKITERLRDDTTLPGPAGVENFVTITGDIHSYLAGYIKENYDDRTCQGENRPVGVELVCGSITSSNLSEIATFGFGSAPQPDVGPVHRAGDRQQPPHQVLQLQRARLQHHGGHEELDPLHHEGRPCCRSDAREPRPGYQGREPPEHRDDRAEAVQGPRPGTTFAGLQITEPLIFDETNGAPVPLVLPCEVSLSPGPGGTL
jgi:hypothetical protein